MLISPIVLIYQTIVTNPTAIFTAPFYSQISLVTIIPLIYKGYTNGYFSIFSNIKDWMFPKYPDELTQQVKATFLRSETNIALIKNGVMEQLLLIEKQLVTVQASLIKDNIEKHNKIIDALKILNEQINELRLKNVLHETSSSTIVSTDIATISKDPIESLKDNRTERDILIEVLNRQRTILEEAQQRTINSEKLISRTEDKIKEDLLKIPDPLADRIFFALTKITVSALVIQGCYLSSKYYLGSDSVLDLISSLTFGTAVSLPLALTGYYHFDKVLPNSPLSKPVEFVHPVFENYNNVSEKSQIIKAEEKPIMVNVIPVDMLKERERLWTENPFKSRTPLIPHDHYIKHTFSRIDEDQ